MALLSVGAVTQYSQLSSPGDPGAGPGDLGAEEVSSARTTRNAAPSLPPLQVLAPGAGAKVDGEHLLFRWSPVPGSGYYDVRIVSDAGDLVIEQRVDITEWRAPASLELHPGTEYFIRIEAYPLQAKTITSDHLSFFVSD
jgi:hypothetical protein